MLRTIPSVQSHRNPEATIRARQPGRKNPPDSVRANGVAASIRDFKQLRQANRQLVHDLRKAMEGLQGEPEKLVRNVSYSSETKMAVEEELTHFTDRKRSRK